MADDEQDSDYQARCAKKVAARRPQWQKVFQKWDLETGHKLIYDAEPWLTEFRKASSHRDGTTLRTLRVFILNGIRKACTPNENDEFSYELPDGTRVVFCNSKQKMIEQCATTSMHTFGGDWNWDDSLPKASEIFSTEVDVVEGDCLEAAERLIARGLRPVVLNMASDYTPGGGYKGGAGAQEENLFRRTNLLHVLANEGRWYNPKGKGVVPPNKMYPLPDPSCLYSPSAFVMRASEANGYAWLPKPYEVAFIASAAYRRPELKKDHEHMIPKFEEGFLKKARALLWTAAHFGHDSVVLSAWGCGAFRNPPKHIAELFKQVLAEPWIQGRFKNITFAIFDDHNANKDHNPDGNVKPFIQVFKTKDDSPTQRKSNARRQETPQAASSSSTEPNGE